MKTLTFPSLRGCLSYIVYDDATKLAAIIDPSEEIETVRYIEAIDGLHLSLAYIIETHTHADHISSSKEISKVTGAGIVRHENAPSKRIDMSIGERTILPLGDSTLEIFPTPGHTDDSISIYTGREVFTGDALLIGSTGRTDFQNGDSGDLYHSIHHIIGRLDGETIVRPAHDYKQRFNSSIREELANNPRMQLCEAEFILAMNAHHPDKPELFDEAIAKNGM